VNFNRQDIQAFCDDLSSWITELGLVSELEKAFPKGKFPLEMSEDDEIEESLDVLLYLTLWMCLKNKSKAPPHLEARMIFAGKTKGPWPRVYGNMCRDLEASLLPTNLESPKRLLELQEIFELAS
jgi:hypothetical protein